MGQVRILARGVRPLPPGEVYPVSVGDTLHTMDGVSYNVEGEYNPNPGAGDTLFYHGFDIAGTYEGPNHYSGFDGAVLYADSGATIQTVVDGTAIGARSIQVGITSGPGDKAPGIYLPGWSSRKKVHVRVRFKTDATADNSGIRKMIRFLNGETMVGTFNAQWDNWVLWNDYTSQGNYYGSNSGTYGPDTTRNQWRWLEFMMDYSAGSSWTGKMWVDGNLVINETISASVSSINLTGAFLAGPFNSPGDDRTEWWDEITVSTDYIGVS